MKRLSILVVIVFTAIVAQGQTRIKLEEVSQHIGDSVELCGKIYGGRWLQSATGRPTLLNVGALYPNQLLTVVIWGKDRMNFDYAPDKELIGKEVCITGKIELHKDKPQIVLYNQEQVKIQDN